MAVWSSILAVIGFAGTLILLNNASVQHFWVMRILEKQGVEAHFDELHFDFLISDKISLRGAYVVLPDGQRVRVEKFSARHNGTRGLFSGAPSFRDFSCEGFALDDARGRRLLRFSATAKQLGVDFLPWAPLEKFTLGSPLPWSFSAENLRVRFGGKILAEGSVRGDFVGAEPLNISGNISGDFAAVLAQPFFEKINNVASGTFMLSGQGRIAQLSLKNLRSRYGEIEIPALSFSAKRGQGATGTLKIEILGEEKSDAEVNFSRLAFGEGQLIFSGAMHAKTIVVSDVIHAGLLFRGWRSSSGPGVPVSGEGPVPVVVPTVKPTRIDTSPEKEEKKLLPGETSVAKKSSAAEHVPEQDFPVEAFWNGISGSMDFCVEHVVFPENEFGTHEGRFFVSENRIGVQYALPEIYCGNAEGAFALNFSKNAPHYHFSGEMFGRGIEIHRIIPALRSRNPAPVEGRFDMDFSVSAYADSPENLEKSVVVNFGLKNFGSGRIRIFNADSKKIRLAGEVLKIGGNLADLIGGLTRKLEPNAANLAEAAGTVKDLLTDFSYSEMSLSGRYRVGEDLVCEHFELGGRDLKISGHASVRPVAGVAPESWPITLSVSPAVRGELSRALGVLGLLRDTGTPDADGFVAARALDFTGTPSDCSDKFFENLMDAASGRKIRYSDEERAPAENLLDIFAL